MAGGALSLSLPGQGVEDLDMAKGYLSRLRGERATAAAEYDRSMNARTERVDRVKSLLEAATASMRASRVGELNLPALAMASGLLSSTRAGSAAEGFSAGLGAAVPALAAQRAQRAQDDQLETTRGLLPEQMYEAIDKDRAARAFQTEQGLRTAETATEGAIIRTAPKLAPKPIPWHHIQNAAMKEYKAMYGDKEMSPADAAEAYKRVLASIIARLDPSERPTGAAPPPIGVDDPTAPKPAPTTPIDAREKDATVGPSPSALESAARIGLPPPPTFTADEGLSTKARTEVRKQMLEAWNKGESDRAKEAKQLADEVEELNRAAALNRRMNSGSINRLMPNTSSEAVEFQKIAGRMAQKQRQPGTGAVSDFDAKSFLQMVPGPDKDATTNKNVIEFRRRVIEMEQAFLDYRAKYVRHYGTTEGAAEAWADYTNSPFGKILDPNAPTQEVRINPAYVDWKEYFKAKRAGPVDMRAPRQ